VSDTDSFKSPSILTYTNCEFGFMVTKIDFVKLILIKKLVKWKNELWLDTFIWKWDQPWIWY